MPAEAAIMHFDLRYGDGTVPLDVDAAHPMSYISTRSPF